MPTCFYHHDRETLRVCSRCGRPACPDCLRDASVGSHCWECVKAAAPPRREVVRQWNASQPTLVTNAMVAINLGIWVLLLILSKRQDGGRYLDNWGVDAPDLAFNHEWWRIVTSGFMHVSLIHVGMNCAILWQLGQLTERAYGRSRFLLLYFAALCAGAFGAVLLSPNNLTVGASGAVFGLLGAALFELRGNGVSITRTPVFATLVINLVFTLAIPGISVGGHIGGLTGGLIVGWVYSQRQRANISRHLQWLVPVAVIGISVAGALIAAQAAVN